MLNMTLKGCQRHCWASSSCAALVHNVYLQCYLRAHVGVRRADSEAHGTTLCLRKGSTANRVSWGAGVRSVWYIK